MEKAIEILIEELKKARLEYERAEAILHNPYARAEHYENRQFYFGRWNGLAKAVEALKSVQ